MKTHFRKFIASGLAVLMVLMLFMLTSCGSSSATSGQAPNSDSASAPAPDTAETSDKAEAPVSDGETYNFAYASFQADGGAFNTLLEKPYVDLVNELSGGRINITIYSGGSLLGMGEIYSGVVAGSADLGIDCANMYAGRFPISAMFEYPGTGFINSEAASRAYTEAIETLQPPEFDDVHLLWLQCVGPGALLTTTKVETLDDLRGLQIRTSNTFADGVKRLGGVPVSMGMGDVYEALRLNTIQGYTAAGEALQGFKLCEVADYCVMNPLFNGTFQFVMNKEAYDSLPADLQQVMDDAAKQIWEEAAIYYFTDQCDKAIAYAEETNPDFEFSEIDEAEMARWREAVIGSMDDYAKELDDMGIDGTGTEQYLLELVEKYNEQCK